MRPIYALLTLILLGGGFCFADNREPIPVLVSILPQKYFVDKIAGNLVKVTVLIEPGHAPATFEPTARQMELASQAKVYLRIGVPFEANALSRLQAANPSLRIVDTHATVAARVDDSEDPHIWTNPLYVKEIAEIIKDALIALLPQKRQELQSNFVKFSKELTELDQDIRAVLKPLKKRKFMVFHPAWGHFARAYDLQQLAIEQHGKEPGAKTLAAIIQQGRQEKIHVIFIQEQFSKHLAERIAREIGAKVLKLDPLAENYTANIRFAAETLRKVEG